jgi:hypothetical protein
MPNESREILQNYCDTVGALKIRVTHLVGSSHLRELITESLQFHMQRSDSAGLQNRNPNAKFTVILVYSWPLTFLNYILPDSFEIF